jgi:hypothetical protein
MQTLAVLSRTPVRRLAVVALLGTALLVLDRLLGSRRARHERKHQREALQTWEGEGGALKPTAGSVGTR